MYKKKANFKECVNLIFFLELDKIELTLWKWFTY